MGCQVLPLRSVIILFLSFVTLLLLKAALYADVIIYEGNVHPESVAWERVGTFDADRFLLDGWLIIDVDLGDWAPPPGGEQDFYTRSISEFTGQPFFLEWRCMTDAPNSEIPGVGGSALNASGSSVSNHFTISEDKVRIWRSNTIPFVFVDIEGGVPHIYRIEQYRDQLYIWYVDGEIVDSGVPLGGFPDPSASIIWGSKMWFAESTNEWDYIRFGTIPEDGSGDYDSDGSVALDDFYFLHECVSNTGPDVDAGPGCRFADFDFDSDVDLLDFADFQLNFTARD